MASAYINSAYEALTLLRQLPVNRVSIVRPESGAVGVAGQ